jgi:hypothetical protein
MREEIIHAAATGVAEAWLSSHTPPSSEKMWVVAVDELGKYRHHQLSKDERGRIIFTIAPEVLARLQSEQLREVEAA